MDDGRRHHPHPYYAYGLLTKFFHGPAAVHQVESGDPLVRAAAVRHEYDRDMVDRHDQPQPQSTAVFDCVAKDPGKSFRKYVYDPAHVPVTDDGDLQEPAGKVAASGLRLADTVPAESLVVYTTAYQDQPPALCAGYR